MTAEKIGKSIIELRLGGELDGDKGSQIVFDGGADVDWESENRRDTYILHYAPYEESFRRE